jgi:Tfp pilus assembly protein PilN
MTIHFKQNRNTLLLKEITQYIQDIDDLVKMRDNTPQARQASAKEYSQINTDIEVMLKVLERLNRKVK